MIVHDVEQRSPEWYALRAGMPTASEFSKIVTSKGEASKTVETYAISLAAELYAGKPVDAWEGNAWTERGRELEDAALTQYGFVNECEVKPIGFITNDLGSMGCSPDGLVSDDGMVEIKCLKAENHVKALLYFNKHGKCPTTYAAQTQGQILIAERAWCDLVFYHPDLPPLTIRQEPDKAIVDGLIATLPKLMTERDLVLAVLKTAGGVE